MAIHEKIPLRFSCTGCGACCSGGGDYYVFLERGEAETIRRHLGVSLAWFRRRYLTRTPEDEVVLASDKQGRCTFLGADNGCRIYRVRPLQCRTYPFWPETMASQAAWRREAKRCEGVDQGAVVSVTRIRAALARHKKAEAAK